MFFRTMIVMLMVLAASATPALAQKQDVLRIGYQKSGIALVLLKGSGELEKRLAPLGIAVKWVEFPGGPQLLEGLNVGAIDFGHTGETPPIFAQAAGASLVYVANEPASPTAEAILVPKDSALQSVADLKGKRVALNKGSNVHYLLVQALQESGLRYQDITPVYLSPADARAAFERNNVDAWVIWDPFAAAAEQQIQARRLRDGSGIVANYQFYLATRSFATRSPQVVNALIDEINRIDENTRTNSQAVARQIAPLLGVPLDVARITLERQGYGASAILPEVITGQQRIADTFAGLKLIPKPLDVKEAMWTPSAQESRAAAVQPDEH